MPGGRELGRVCMDERIFLERETTLREYSTDVITPFPQHARRTIKRGGGEKQDRTLAHRQCGACSLSPLQPRLVLTLYMLLYISISIITRDVYLESISKHILNAQVSIRSPCCRQWFDCAECHAEVADHKLAKTIEMAFLCKKCKKAFRKDMSAYEESDEYCPHCDNHYVSICTFSTRCDRESM